MPDGTPQGLAAAHQDVDSLGYARLGCHPLLQQCLEPIDIKLREQKPESRVRRRLGYMGAKQIVEVLAVALGKTLYSEQ